MLKNTRILGDEFPGENPFKASEVQIAAWKAEQERRTWSDHVKDARIPKRYRNAKMDDCTDEVRAWLDKALQGEAGWLVLAGSNGTGKTHQACACAICAARYKRVRYTTMGEIVDDIQSAYGKSGNAAKVFRRYKEVPLLVIDEIEKFVSTDRVAQLAYRLVDERYSAKLPTIVITNLTPKAMFSAFAKAAGESLADSFVSRISDRRHTHVELDGADRRLTGHGLRA